MRTGSDPTTHRCAGSGCDRGGIDPRRCPVLGDVRSEPGTPALGVQTRSIVAVSMHELRVFTGSAEDPGGARPLCLLAGRLHPGTVSHLGELAHRSNGQRRSVESPHRSASSTRFATRGCSGPRCTDPTRRGSRDARKAWAGARGGGGERARAGRLARVRVRSGSERDPPGRDRARDHRHRRRSHHERRFDRRSARRSTTSCSTTGTRSWWGRIRGSALGSRSA